MKWIHRFLAVVVLFSTTGCFEDGSPETARLRIDGSGEVRIITSTNFDFEDTDMDGEEEINFISVDSMRVTLPFDAHFSVRERGLFFARAVRLDTPLSGVRMRVFIDEEPRYDQALGDGEPALQFVFNAIIIN